jgi:hypothetical protein
VALSRVACKLTSWFHVDDMFMILPCGPEKLNDFLNHFNSIHPNIKFIMGPEFDDHLPFLDIDVLAYIQKFLD